MAITATLVVLLLAAPGQAATAPDDTTAVLETIEILAPRHGQLTADHPEAVSVTSRERLDRSAAAVLTDAFRDVPAVHLQSTTAGQGSPFIRGLTGSAVLNLVDGMRLNNALYRSAPNPWLALIDPDLVERVELVRGPSSVLYGSDAMSGVVQVLTRRARGYGDTPRGSGRLKTSLSSADRGAGLRAELGVGHDKLAFRGGVSQRSAGDLRAGGTVGRQAHSAYDMVTADGSLSWLPRPEQELRLDYQFARQPRSPRHDELVAGFGQDEPSSDLFLFQPLQRSFAHAAYFVELPAGGLVESVQADLALQEIRENRRSRDHGSVIESDERNRSTLLGFTAQAHSSTAGGSRLTWGGESYFDVVDSARDEVDTSTGDRQAVTPRFPDGSRMNSYGLYLSVEQDLARDLLLRWGLRYSLFDIHLASTSSSEAVDLRPDDLTGSVGLSWKATSSLRVVGNFQRGFRAPNIFDLGTLGPRPGNRFNIPATDLEPEELYSVEAGLKFADHRARGEVLVFHGWYRDKISSVLTGEQTPSGRDIVTSANVASVKLLGVEANGSIDLGRRLELRAGLAWVRGQQDDGDGSRQPADRTPPLSGSLGLPWQLGEQLWLEPSLRFAAPQDRLSDRDLADPRIDPAGSAGWATVELRARWFPRADLSVTAVLENLGDVSYRVHGSGMQSPGFNFRLALDASFD